MTRTPFGANCQVHRVGGIDLSFVRVAENYRPMLIVMCPSAATESDILFSFETDLLRRVKLDWSNRAASVAPLAFGSPRCDKRVIGATPMTTFTRAGRRAEIGR